MADLIVVKSGESSGILQREIEPSNLIIPMNDQSSIKLTIAFDDPDLEPEERDEQAQRFLAELKQVDEVESVERLLDHNPPEGNKSLGGFLVGMLLAEVNLANGKKLWFYQTCEVRNSQKSCCERI